ncbi:cyclic nucleotide-binding domain-containing protein [Pedobacter sp. JY14-1]|uniref:Crp/Fnr family transcriptional regulator n=1 Tax=Pedobacter sp. JY14-1 TaxID=3034151 RepID=UPI0023E28C68|nr:cyclic nucleotide-binding domain-containing protein [Pedobacter sp. JY14-1]
MSKYDDVFEALLALLQSIRPEASLPEELAPLLWQVLSKNVEISTDHVLEEKDRRPRHAYYVVKGYVWIYAWGLNGYRYLFRIYRPGTIVALMDFINQEESQYEIVTGKGTTVRKIAVQDMERIYSEIPGMKEFAYYTALRYNQYKEKLHRDLLALEDLDERVLTFYRYFPGMLPANQAPIRSRDLADFLGISVRQLADARSRMKEQMTEIMDAHKNCVDFF